MQAVRGSRLSPHRQQSQNQPRLRRWCTFVAPMFRAGFPDVHAAEYISPSENPTGIDPHR